MRAASPARIVVDSRARLDLGALPVTLANDLAEEIRQATSYRNPVYAQQRSLGILRPDAPPMLSTWREEGGWLSVPRGALGKLRQALRGLGLGWAVEDRRSEGDPELRGRVPPHRLELFGYQERAVAAVLARENCLLRAPTGSGKTCVAFALAARINLPTLVVVWTGSLYEQWIVRCGAELGLDYDEVGRVRGDERIVRSITVAMLQSLYANPGWVDENAARFGALVFDEVQLAPCDTAMAVIDRFPARYRVGISADQTRKDGLEFLTYDAFGEVAVEVPRQELEASGHVHGVAIRVVPTEFRAPWYQPGRRRPRPTDHNRLLAEMCGDEARTALAVELCAAEALAGEPVIVWSARVEHCLRIDALLARAGVRSGLLLGGAAERARFAETRAGLEDGSIGAGVGTLGAIGQGLDVPRLSRGVVATPLAGNRQKFDQARGRICRLDRAGGGKRDAVMYVLSDVLVSGARDVRNLSKWYGAAVTVRDGAGWIAAREWLRLHRLGRYDEARGQSDAERIFG